MTGASARRPILRRVREKLRRRFVPRCLILMYHRIAEERPDPWRLCVSPANFDSQLETLRALDIRVLHVSDLVKQLAAGRVPARSVAITFDDGYQDNLEHGRPSLERYDVPATLFATAGYIGRNEEFWWDVLERVFLQAGELPEALELHVDGQLRRWELGPDACFTAADAERWPDWKPFRPAPTRRHRLHDDLWLLLVGARASERARIVAQLVQWTGEEQEPRPTRRVLTEEGLRRLGGDGLVEIGAHSLTHPALSELPVDEQAYELEESKSRLEAVLGRPVTGLSYPNGRSTAETERLAIAAGYDFACGSKPAAVERSAHPFQLPRVVVGNWDGPAFRSLLAGHIAV